MIDSVLELVNKTASNSLFMFLFCNFIIILILVGNSKPGSDDNSYPGSQETLLISDPVLSSKSGFEKPESVLSSKPGYQKSESALSSKSQSVLISDSVLSSKPGFEKRVLISESIAVTSKPRLQEPGLISKSSLSSKPAVSEQFRTSKPGLRVIPSGLKPGSDFSEKDEKGITKKESLLEVENESDVECVLRRRVEEFIRKVNTQWKSENIKSDYLLH